MIKARPKKKSSIKSKKSSSKLQSARYKAWQKRKRQIKKSWDQLVKRFGYLSLFALLFIVLSVLFFFKWYSHQGGIIEPADPEASLQAVREAFVKDLVPTAQNLQREYGVLASVSLAQAMLESNFGTSQLASEHKNLYGVKTDSADPQGALYKTLEYVDDQWVEIEDYFKVYPSWQASMEEHARLIQNGTTWNADQYEDVLAATTYQGQAKALQSSGYATDPGYSQKLIEMIEQWNLNSYDQPVDQAPVELPLLEPPAQDNQDDNNN